MAETMSRLISFLTDFKFKTAYCIDLCEASAAHEATEMIDSPGHALKEKSISRHIQENLLTGLMH